MASWRERERWNKLVSGSSGGGRIGTGFPVLQAGLPRARGRLRILGLRETLVPGPLRGPGSSPKSETVNRGEVAAPLTGVPETLPAGRVKLKNSKWFIEKSKMPPDPEPNPDRGDMETLSKKSMRSGFATEFPTKVAAWNGVVSSLKVKSVTPAAPDPIDMAGL